MGAEVTLVARTAARSRGGGRHPRQGRQGQDPRPRCHRSRGFGAAIAARPPFHVLVNNAGTNRTSPFLEVKVVDFDLVMDLNLRAAFFVAQAVARGLAASGEKGSIINISSQMGHVGAAIRRSIAPRNGRWRA